MTRSNPDSTQNGGLPGSDGDESLHAVLFDAEGSDRQVAIADIHLDRLSERQLLWLDARRDSETESLEWLQRLGLDAAIPAIEEGNGKPALQNFGDWFLLRVIAVTNAAQLKYEIQPLTVISGRNFVVTVHLGSLEYLDELRQRECADTKLGVLSAESFTASLLDWQLTTYFDAVTRLESAVDRLEVQVLARRVQRENLPKLSRLRRGTSRLRRLLAPHRAVFAAMARPDFRPESDGEADKHFRAINERFERALDAVESARELVVGSFELLATRMAQQTNDTMRVLTFVTVLLGSLAVLAGVLGMNFEAPIFRTGERGFLMAIGVMAVIAVAALVVARWRRWL